MFQCIHHCMEGLTCGRAMGVAWTSRVSRTLRNQTHALTPLQWADLEIRYEGATCWILLRGPHVEVRGAAGCSCLVRGPLHHRRGPYLRGVAALPAALLPPGDAQDPGRYGLHRRGRTLQSTDCERGAPQEEDRWPASGLSERVVPSPGHVRAEDGPGPKRHGSRYDTNM